MWPHHGLLIFQKLEVQVTDIVIGIINRRDELVRILITQYDFSFLLKITDVPLC